MSPREQIIRAQPQDTDVLSQIIATSFHGLAPSLWLIPDPDARRQIFPGYFRLLVVEAMQRGYVYTTAGRAAAALWLPVGEVGEPSPAGYDEALATKVGPWIDRFRAFDDLLHKHHPTGQRHDHLAILGVHPEHQRRGIGTELLSAHHRRLDESDPPTAAYLEASDATTRELYLRNGYSDYGSPIRLPDGPPMFPMVRLTTATADEAPQRSQR